MPPRLTFLALQLLRAQLLRLALAALCVRLQREKVRERARQASARVRLRNEVVAPRGRAVDKQPRVRALALCGKNRRRRAVRLGRGGRRAQGGRLASLAGVNALQALVAGEAAHLMTTGAGSEHQITLNQSSYAHYLLSSCIREKQLRAKTKIYDEVTSRCSSQPIADHFRLSRPSARGPRPQLRCSRASA